MDILELVIADHDAIAGLVARLAPIAEDGPPERARELVARLAIAFKTHARAEERVLYEAVRAGPPALAMHALEGPHAHHAVDVLVDRLAAQRPGRELAAILHVFDRLFIQHARIDEELGLLPRIAEALSPPERARLAHDFTAEARRIRPAIARAVGAPRAADRGRGHGLHVHAHGHRR